MKKQNMINIRWILVALFVLTAGCFYGCGQEGDQVVRLSGESRTEETAFLLPGGEDGQDRKLPGSAAGYGAGVEEGPGSGAGMEQAWESAAGQPREEPGVCYVHVCGEVVRPGVYQLREGQRIYEAVEAAGGFTPQASPTWLNLAEKVRDGMKLEVPDLDTAAELSASQEAGAAAGSGSVTNDGRININTATREELMRLNGIGETRAEDIISYRQEKGYFQAIEDIMKVPGIKNAAFQKIKDDIVVWQR